MRINHSKVDSLIQTIQDSSGIVMDSCKIFLSVSTVQAFASSGK